MKEKRTIELTKGEVAEILAKHFGISWVGFRFRALNEQPGSDIEIYWEGRTKEEVERINKGEE